MHSIPSIIRSGPAQERRGVSVDQEFWTNRVGECYGSQTPFILTDPDIIRQQGDRFKTLLPRVDLHYAIKAYPEPRVILSLDQLVGGYDVASVPEIELLLSLGVTPRRISYNNPVKSSESIAKSVSLGISRFVFQSKEEADKIVRYLNGGEVLVRVKMHDSEGAQSFSSKFGCPPDEAVALLAYAKSVGLKSLGVTFHIGSQASEMKAWDESIRKAQSILAEARQSGLDVDVINIGGGIPAQYSANDPDLREIAEVINGAIANGPSDITYIAEPGRFLTADSSVIVATVIGRENRDGMPWLYLDVGTFQAFMEVFEFGKFHYPVFPLRHGSAVRGKVAKERFVLTGPTCDSYDTMVKGVPLPADMKEGDKVVIGMAGAYTIVYGGNFNGFGAPHIEFVSYGESAHEERSAHSRTIGQLPTSDWKGMP